MNRQKQFRKEFYYTGNDEDLIEINGLLCLFGFDSPKNLSDWMKSSKIDLDPSFIDRNNKLYLRRYKENEFDEVSQFSLTDAASVATGIESIAKSINQTNKAIERQQQVIDEANRNIHAKIDKNCAINNEHLKHTKAFDDFLGGRIERLHVKFNNDIKNKDILISELNSLLHNNILQNKEYVAEIKRLNEKLEEIFNNPDILIRELSDKYKVDHNRVLDVIYDKLNE